VVSLDEGVENQTLGSMPLRQKGPLAQQALLELPVFATAAVVAGVAGSLGVVSLLSGSVASTAYSG